MSPPLTWVVGRGGLLGSALARRLGASAWTGAPTIRWSSDEAESDISRALDAFSAARGGGRWAVAWCAGANVMTAAADAMHHETSLFDRFLARLAQTRGLGLPEGRIFLASSAGGVYGGNRDGEKTERSVPVPGTPYGHAKLAEEEALARWVERHPGSRALVGRISTLYGSGQKLEKPQGLIAWISRALIYRVPIHIYVPLDTRSDLVFVDDAAHAIVSGLERLDADERDRTVTKLIVSERETSVATVLAIFRQISKRRLPLVLGQRPDSLATPGSARFRSIVWSDLRRPPIDLLSGFSFVHQHQLELHRSGRLPPPPLGSLGEFASPRGYSSPSIHSRR